MKPFKIIIEACNKHLKESPAHAASYDAFDTSEEFLHKNALKMYKADKKSYQEEILTMEFRDAKFHKFEITSDEENHFYIFKNGEIVGMFKTKELYFKRLKSKVTSTFAIKRYSDVIKGIGKFVFDNFIFNERGIAISDDGLTNDGFKQWQGFIELSLKDKKYVYAYEPSTDDLISILKVSDMLKYWKRTNKTDYRYVVSTYEIL